MARVPLQLEGARGQGQAEPAQSLQQSLLTAGVFRSFRIRIFAMTVKASPESCGAAGVGR